MASLNLKISAQEDTNSFVVTDCTGLFSSQSNPGGWGAQTIQLKEITDATLEITPPNQLAPILIRVYPDFPNGNSKVGYEILPFMVNMKEIESGLWTIKLTVTGVTIKGVQFTKWAVTQEIFTKNIFCCIDKLQPKLSTDCFKDAKQKQIIVLSNLVQSAKYKEECDLINESVKIIEYLKAQCTCVGC